MDDCTRTKKQRVVKILIPTGMTLNQLVSCLRIILNIHLLYCQSNSNLSDGNREPNPRATTLTANSHNAA